MVKSEGLRAAGYRRVSMREQVEGHSLEAQAVNLRKFCEDQGWELVQIYTDAGLSAKKGSHRPALEQLLADAQEGRFEVVVVDKIDRFYRHLNGLLTALDRLNQWGVAFASVQEKLDFTTPWGKLMLAVLGILAEIYLENLRQETRKGKHQRAREGLWNGSIPLGYCRGLCRHCRHPNGKDYCPDYGQPDKGDGKTLIVHPVESQAVKLAFAWYLSREYSDAKIARRLNVTKVSLPGGGEVPLRPKGTLGKTRPGKFSKDNVRGILGRVFYTGKVPYFGVTENGRSRKRLGPVALYPGRHPALVTPADFDRVQELRAVLGKNGRRRGGKPMRLFPLTGILRCGLCGNRMRGVSVQGRTYYRDVTQIEHTGDCSQPHVRAKVIEDQVLAVLQRAADNPELEARLTTAQAQLQALEDRLQRAGELYLLGVIDRRRLERERKQKEKREKTLRGMKPDAILASIDALRQSLAEWASKLPIERKKLLQGRFEAAYVRKDVLVAVQPRASFLPVLIGSLGAEGEPGSSCGPDGNGTISKHNRGDRNSPGRNTRDLRKTEVVISKVLGVF